MYKNMFHSFSLKKAFLYELKIHTTFHQYCMIFISVTHSPSDDGCCNLSCCFVDNSWYFFSQEFQQDNLSLINATLGLWQRCTSNWHIIISCSHRFIWFWPCSYTVLKNSCLGIHIIFMWRRLLSRKAKAAHFFIVRICHTYSGESKYLIQCWFFKFSHLKNVNPLQVWHQLWQNLKKTPENPNVWLIVEVYI